MVPGAVVGVDGQVAVVEEVVVAIVVAAMAVVVGEAAVVVMVVAAMEVVAEVNQVYGNQKVVEEPRALAVAVG